MHSSNSIYIYLFIQKIPDNANNVLGRVLGARDTGQRNRVLSYNFPEQHVCRLLLPLCEAALCHSGVSGTYR